MNLPVPATNLLFIMTTIKHWALDDRPREKLILKGIDSLSDAELLAILIGSGTRKKSAVEVAKSLLASADNRLSTLCKYTLHELMQTKGIGKVRAITLMAGMELGRRREKTSVLKNQIQSSAEVARYLQSRFKDRLTEVFAVAYLNRANKLNHLEVISEGGLTGTVADPRVIFKKALQYNAVSLILCHNHPSGNLKPSLADEELTIKLREAARFFDMQVLDHVIVSDEGYFSFADEGLI
jgi:DNA repair protein RadC